MAAQLAPITLRLGGKVRSFPLLTVEDLCNLTALLPLNEAAQEIVNIRALYQWASHPRGCAQVILASAGQNDPKLTLGEVEGWGSVMQRCKLASAIMDRSLANGEEPETDEASAANPTSGTGGSRPPSSPTGAPDSATPGG